MEMGLRIQSIPTIEPYREMSTIENTFRKWNHPVLLAAWVQIHAAQSLSSHFVFTLNRRQNLPNTH
ncbi:unnamed protein product [Nezara viridula]|uniref:Uncharacterized protein n=1 Tax=Nezara viridula TaxID=85310 RepID=A0A9P0MYF9_NEZVI|nr:unnamed protein product [Nezara viridula]